MQIAPDPYSDRIVSNMLKLCVSELGASFAMLFWFDDAFNLIAPETLAMPQDLLSFYDRHVGQNDPLHVLSLAESGSRMTSLRARSEVVDRCHPAYRAFLERFAIHDELDMVFWRDNRPAAGIALFRDSVKGSFHAEGRNWDVIHSHFDCGLQAHHRLRDGHLRHILARRYGLSPSEINIVRAMMSGATNNEIAEDLNLKISTIKSYVFSIFNKIGVDNRTSVVAALYNATIM